MSVPKRASPLSVASASFTRFVSCLPGRALSKIMRPGLPGPDGSKLVLATRSGGTAGQARQAACLAGFNAGAGGPGSGVPGASHERTCSSSARKPDWAGPRHDVGFFWGRSCGATASAAGAATATPTLSFVTRTLTNGSPGARPLGDLRSAYCELDGLSGYPEGFFTKYLYFGGHGSNWDQQPSPLIFDSVVRRTLAFLAEVLNASWILRPARRAPVDLYLHYFTTLHDWAGDLTHGGSPCSADQIELFLFNPQDLIFDPRAELRHLAIAAAADVGTGVAGPEVTVALARLPPDLPDSIGVDRFTCADLSEPEARP